LQIVVLPLPPNALKDIRLLIELDEKKLPILGELFATAESLPPLRQAFLRQAAESLQIDLVSARTVVVTCQVLMSWVEQGAKPAEVVREIRDFLAAMVSAGERERVLNTFDAKRSILEMVLTPKAARLTAQKVRYLTYGLEPTVDSFRTVCELRPVFEGLEGQETIIGYAPIVIFEVKLSGGAGEQTVLLHFSPEMLKSLGDVVKRTEKKLEAIKGKFGDALLSG
jgi:hypothetical protein